MGFALLNFAILTQFQENFPTVRRGVAVEINKVAYYVIGSMTPRLPSSVP